MVKWSWSQGHDVEQHSRAELQVQTIYQGTAVVSNERLQGRKRCLGRGEDIKPTGTPRFLWSAMALADTR